jgi:hypothetical protein
MEIFLTPVPRREMRLGELPDRVAAVPREMSVTVILDRVVAAVETNNASFRIRPGYVEITTIERAGIRGILWEHVHAVFDRRPLAYALDDIYQLTGVSVILDPRAGNRALQPITANFSRGPALGVVLLLLSEMADLKMLVGENVIYMTTPNHAQQLLRERLWIPFHMQAVWQPRALKRVE